jgi:hypothetical protein
VSGKVVVCLQGECVCVCSCIIIICVEGILDITHETLLGGGLGGCVECVMYSS